MANHSSWLCLLADLIMSGKGKLYGDTYIILGFPDSSVGKEFTFNAGDLSLIPGLGRSIGEGIGYPLQYSWASLVAQLVRNPSAMQETCVRSLCWKDLLEKGRATHSAFWPGEFHGLYSPWGHKESDKTERLSLSHIILKRSWNSFVE